MKFIHFWLFLLITNNILLAQQGGINQLIRDLDHSQTDSAKLAAYRQIIIHYATVNSDSQNWYANQGINYARSRNYPVGEAQIVAQLAVLDQNQGRIELSEQRLKAALTIYRHEKYLKGVAETLHNLGTIEGAKSNYDAALKYYFSSLRVYDSVNDPHGRMMTYMNLGSIYMEHHDTANARKYLRTAEDISRTIPLTNASIYLYNIIGVLLAETGKPDSALLVFKNNLNLSEKPEFVKSHLESLIYLGETYLEIGLSSEGSKYLEDALKIARENKISEMEGNVLMDLARVNETNNPKRAIEYLTDAKTICEEIKSKPFLITIYKELGDIYERQGNYKEALTAFRQAQNIADSVFTINKAKEIANINAAYDYETNKEIKALNTLSRHNARQRDEIIIVAACLIVVLIVLFVYYSKIIRLNRQLKAHESQLQEINGMKDKLFSVIGHDLRGPIARIPAMIDIYESEHTTEEEKKFLLENLREHTKASLETFDKLLYWGQSLMKGVKLHQVKMQSKGYIKEAIDLRRIKAAEKRITIRDNTPADIYVFADPSIFDFIIRNLLANALKYTHAGGTIEVNADTVSKPGLTVFSVRDSGIGMDNPTLSKLFYTLESRYGTEHEKGHGIGLMLCKEFAIQNGGDIWAESEEGKGSTFYFSVQNATDQA